jgi:hypothetical protein
MQASPFPFKPNIEIPSIPPNCSFEIDDCEDAWVYSYQFDYIHGRALATCFRSHLAVFQSAFDALRPGGYFEVQDLHSPIWDFDGTLEGTALQKWANLCMEAATNLGKDWGQVPRYKGYLEQIGFEDVVVKRVDWPLGTWAKGDKAKLMGAYWQEDMMAVIDGFSLGVLPRGQGMSIDEIKELSLEAKKVIQDKKVHSYTPWCVPFLNALFNDANAFSYIVYGRKPKD